MKVAYVRVSTEEQNEARQIEALKKHGIEKWFTEKSAARVWTGPSSKPCSTMCGGRYRLYPRLQPPCPQH